jgi:hypothetical protein
MEFFDKSLHLPRISFHLADNFFLVRNEDLPSQLRTTLQTFYNATDKMISEANIITRLFAQIREFFGANGTELYGPRWFVDDGEPQRRLQQYTEEQAQRNFSGRPLEEGVLYFVDIRSPEKMRIRSPEKLYFMPL